VEVLVLAFAALVGIAAVSGVVLPRLLRRASWPLRSPTLGIAAWVSGSAAFLLSTTLAGLVLISNAEVAAERLAHLLGTCLTAVYDHLGAAAPGLPVPVAGAVVIGGTVLPVLVTVISAVVRTARRRSRHLASLSVVARPGADRTVVLDHPVAAAYCLPAGTVVVTRGALQRLTEPELQAVLAHERAHLRQRHHLLLTGAAACARALPFVPQLRSAGAELPRLVELAADEAAARRCGRNELVAALHKLAPGAGLGEALGAAVSTAERARRLSNGQRRLSWPVAAAVAAGLALLTAAPVGLTAATVMHTTGANHCVHAEHGG
jgi:Zn-dependent protease with chaperone function